MTTQSTKQPQQKHSRLIYGSNAAMLAVFGLALVIAVNVLFSKVSMRTDISSGRVNALAPRTVKLLEELDSKTTGAYTIANLFEAKFNTGAKTEDEQKKNERARTVADALREYSRRSSRIKIVNPGTREDIEAMIKERFSIEDAAYRNAFTDYEDILKSIETFTDKEKVNFGQIAQEKKEGKLTEMAIALRRNFADHIPELIKEGRESVKTDLDVTMPRWNQVVRVAQGSLGAIDMILAQITVIYEDTKNIKPEEVASPQALKMVKHIAEIAGEVTKHRDAIAAFYTKLKGLPESKLSKIDLPNEACLVIFPPAESKQAADLKIISRNELFTSVQGPTGDTEVFDGESAISSALLGLIRPDKTHVVFIAADTALFRQFGAIYSRLIKANFAVDAWTPPPEMDERQDPRMPPPPKNPPFSGKGVIWVVFASQPGFNGVKDEIGEQLKTHLDAGGNAFFLASPAATVILPAETAPATKPENGEESKPRKKFIYADLLAPFGIEVDPYHSIVAATELEDSAGRKIIRSFGMLAFDKYPDDPITRPVQSYRAAFGYPFPTRGGTRFDESSLTSIVKASPAPGVSNNVMMQIPASVDTFVPEKKNSSIEEMFKPANTWASPEAPSLTDDPAKITGAMKGPFDIGVKASKGAGENEQRIVVIGNYTFAFSALIAFSDETEGERNSILPANTELFINSVMWLAKDENHIAVSANAGAATRLNVSPETKNVIDWTILYLGLPLLALVAGGLVWTLRRR